MHLAKALEAADAEPPSFPDRHIDWAAPNGAPVGDKAASAKSLRSSTAVSVLVLLVRSEGGDGVGSEADKANVDPRHGADGHGHLPAVRCRHDVAGDHRRRHGPQDRCETHALGREPNEPAGDHVDGCAVVGDAPSFIEAQSAGVHTVSAEHNFTPSNVDKDTWEHMMLAVIKCHDNHGYTP